MFESMYAFVFFSIRVSPSMVRLTGHAHKYIHQNIAVCLSTHTYDQFYLVISLMPMTLNRRVHLLKSLLFIFAKTYVMQ